MTELSIGDVVKRTGVAEATLRVWERRHGFPRPERLPGGHRRYSERDVELVRRVAAERKAGVALPVAIARAQEETEQPAGSVFATLRRRRPDLEPRTLPKGQMIALSHAIEDESLSRAERPLLFASFQRERFYRQAEDRWRGLSQGAELAVVFADFKRVRHPRGAPAEVPLRGSDPLSREWAVVCDAPGHAVCLAGWEPPGSGSDGRERSFEAIWSVEPDVVREAARICAGIAASARPALVERARARLDAHPPRPAAEQLRLATAITARALAHLAGADPAS
jgi:MerR family transcriptional regulator, light-induced transcriptional regulator